jgi:hypothetical protein
MSTITIVSVNTGESVSAILGAAAPNITAGYSNFESIDRPKRKSVANWVGMNLFAMDVQAMFDGWDTDRSVEHDCAVLESFGMSRGNRGEFPSPIKVIGPVPHSNLEWYLSGVTWEDVIYQNDVRVRQAFTINLLERVNMPLLVRNDAKQNQVKYRVVKVKKGWDLQQIAATHMGESLLWRRITDMKGKKFRDPYVKPGTDVKVPIV